MFQFYMNLLITSINNRTCEVHIQFYMILLYFFTLYTNTPNKDTKLAVESMKTIDVLTKNKRISFQNLANKLNALLTII